MFEPSGASWGQVPLPAGFLAGLRELTRKHGVILIFDEVITGFRWSRGGAQARYRLTPDMCILAKIVAGGLPGGAVAGRADIMSQLDAAAAKAAGREKIGHQGTFNSNPLCAAAAVATLGIVEREDVCAEAERTAGEIREGMRGILVEEQIPWGVYGEASAFLIFQNPNRLKLDPATFDPLAARLQGPQRRAQPQPRLPPANRDAGERRRHHGRAGRPRIGDARARARWRRHSRPSAPPCAGSRSEGDI